jgi:hypothetical protein
MNWDQMKGNWNQFKGKVRQQWGKLTDDDMDKIQGKQEEGPEGDRHLLQQVLSSQHPCHSSPTAARTSGRRRLRFAEGLSAGRGTGFQPVRPPHQQLNLRSHGRVRKPVGRSIGGRPRAYSGAFRQPPKIAALHRAPPCSRCRGAFSVWHCETIQASRSRR